MFQSISDRIAANTDGRQQGMAVADFDDDGECEIFVAGAGSANRVLKWDNNQLVNVTPPILGDGSTFAKTAMAADIDGDGREELYVVNSISYGGVPPIPDRLFDARLDGSWTELLTNIRNPRLRNIVMGRSIAAIDRRGNGRYTFVVLNYRSPLRWFEIDPTGTLVDMAHSLKLDLSLGAEACWVGPITSTRPDLFILNSVGLNFLLANQGDGHFCSEASNHRLDLECDAGTMTIGLDANNDGRFHLALGNHDEPHQLLIRQIDGTFKNEASWGMAMPSCCTEVIAADFDNDGYEELIFMNTTAANRGFRRCDDGQPTWRMFDLGSATEPTQTTTGAAIADIDNDGILELILAHGGVPRAPLTMHKCPAPGNNWVRIQPLTRFGAPARGATIHLYSSNRKQVRVIDGGGSRCSTEPIAHFGLGTAVIIERITITWPDGAKLTLNQPEPRRLHRITYPMG